MTASPAQPGPCAPTIGDDAATLEAARRRDRVVLWAFVAVWAVWGMLLLTVRVAHPGLAIGEDWSDADILNAGRYFDAHGYVATKALPVLETADRPGRGPKPYNTYPPGPFWVHEALKAVGVTSLPALRALFQTWTHLGVLVFFLVARRLTASTAVGAIAASLYMFSVPYAAYSSGFWVNLGQLTLFSTMAAWLRSESAGTPRARRAWVALAAALCFIDSWITLENGVFIAVFVGVRALAVRRRETTVAAGIVGVMPALTASLRLRHQAWSEGNGLEAAVQYFLESASLRSATGETGGVAARFIPVWLARLEWPWVTLSDAAHHQVFAYPALKPVVIAMGLLLGMVIATEGQARLRPARLAVASGVLLTGCGLTWFVLMTNHALEHRFVVLTLMPGLSLLYGGLLWAGLAMWPTAGSRRRVVAWAGPCAAVVLAGTMLADLRNSDTLNSVVTLSAARHERVRFVEQENERVHVAARGLAGVSRLIVCPKRPVIAYSLGVPFIYSDQVPIEPLGPGEAMALDTWSPTLARQVPQLAQRYGLPDVQSVPGRLVVFRAAGPTQTPVRVAVEDGLAVTGLRWARTLDGSGVALEWELEGTVTEALADRFVYGVEVHDASGKELAKNSTRLSWYRCFDDRRAVAWSTVPADAAANGAYLTVLVWDTAKNRFATLSAESLGPGMSVAEDRRSIRWAQGK